MSKDEFFEFFVQTAQEKYIEVMGKEKWESLTNEQKHDVVMMLAKGLLFVFK